MISTKFTTLHNNDNK